MLRFLNADEHNTAIKHAIQEDTRRALSTNAQTQETRAKLQAREQENSDLHAEIDYLQREAEAMQARCESCEAEINSLRPIVVKQVQPSPAPFPRFHSPTA
jgi:predicted RNase H-like nuclease (RuvC/YqgF family)